MSFSWNVKYIWMLLSKLGYIKLYVWIWEREGRSGQVYQDWCVKRFHYTPKGKKIINPSRYQYTMQINTTQYIVLKITYFHFLLSYFQFEGKLKLELHVINIKICGVLSGVPENDLHIPCKQQDTIIAKRQLHDYFMGIYMYEENMSNAHTDL